MRLPRAWEAQEVVIDSPLSVPDALAALAVDVRPWGPFSSKWVPSPTSPFVLSGRVSAEGVRVRALRPFHRNSWRSVLVGRFDPSEEGCRFEGTIGLEPLVVVFSIFWLSFVVLFLAVGITVVVTTCVVGRHRLGPEDVMAVIVPAVLAVFFFLLSTVAMRQAEPEKAYLDRWIHGVLQAG